MSDDTEALEPTDWEHEDIYDVARWHGYANVAPADSREILVRQFGPLSAEQAKAAGQGYAVGRKEAVEHAAELTRPVPRSAEIPF